MIKDTEGNRVGILLKHFFSLDRYSGCAEEVINIKKIVSFIFILTLAGVVVFGAANTYAQSPTPSNPFQTIVQRIAQKFGLNEADVQSVFDEVRQEHQFQVQVKFEERLAQLVTQGEITETQKQLILAKHKELLEKKQQTDWQNMTYEQRRQAKESQRQEMENWAKENGIDLQFIFGGFHKFGWGMGGHWIGR